MFVFGDDGVVVENEGDQWYQVNDQVDQVGDGDIDVVLVDGVLLG